MRTIPEALGRNCCSCFSRSTARNSTDMHPAGERGFCAGTAVHPGKLNVRRNARPALSARPHTAGGAGGRASSFKASARNTSWVRCGLPFTLFHQIIVFIYLSTTSFAKLCAAAAALAAARTLPTERERSRAWKHAQPSRREQLVCCARWGERRLRRCARAALRPARPGAAAPARQRGAAAAYCSRASRGPGTRDAPQRRRAPTHPPRKRWCR